jgi:membrane dipeptidase
MIDLHCDTASRLYYEGEKLKENKFSVDIKKLKEGKANGQVFAHFIELDKCKNPYEEFLSMHNNFLKEINDNKDSISIVTNIDELKLVNNEGKIGAFLSIEEGEVLEGRVERVKEVYDKGIRIITLTWNFPNKIGYPNVDFIHKDKGLSECGKDIVAEMERVGIIPDVSHLSDKGFWDVLDICKKPFIATHSNARSIKEHSRNLTDDMIRKLSEKGGVMGINFCSNFLGESELARLDDMVRHINHIKKVGGIDVIGLGSDFDGIGNKVEIEHIGKIELLAYKLKENGYKESEIDKILVKNAIRLFNDVLK